jgi:anaerobic ribonucleoside-triphosphate reductase activating protein
MEGRGNTTVEEVVDSIIPWISQADGITISGGEPFDQPDALFELTARIRSKTEADILVFTGYPWASIRDMVGTSPAMIDALVTGPFDFEESRHLPCVEATIRNFTSSRKKAAPGSPASSA